MKDIKNDELSNYGIDIKCNVMDPGERRFRLVSADESSYIRTEATSNGGWQKSHYHTTIKEQLNIYCNVNEKMIKQMKIKDTFDAIFTKDDVENLFKN